MSKKYFTITGLNHYYGDCFLERNMIVNLKKDFDNKYDAKAIAVTLPGLGKIGYVANHSYTVIGERVSATSLYDCMDEDAKGKILYIMENGVVCEFM